MSRTIDIDFMKGPLAVGRTAEVFDVDADTVVKRLRPGFDLGILTREFVKTEAVRAVGGPVPEMLGLVEAGGQPGLLMERVDGGSMFDSMLSGPDLTAHCAHFADLHAVVLGLPSVGGLPDVKEFLANKIDLTSLPLRQRTQAKDHLISLPDGRSSLHGDFHPGNILITSQGAVVIDWSEATRGDPAADIARTLILLTPEAAADEVDNVLEIAEEIHRFVLGYQLRCLATTGLTAERVAAWRLPVVAARLSEGIAAETASLEQEVARLTS